MAGRRCETRGAFTLLELLVVIAIIMVLSGLSFVAIGIVIKKAHVAQAGVEVTNLQGAVEAYRHALGAYPPDTGGWNETVTDPRSIHRYLCRRIVDPLTKKKVGPFFSISSIGAGRVLQPDADGVGVLADPWGNPYQLDAMHIQTVGGQPKAEGEPYLPSRPEIDRTRDYKIVSFGPDGESADYPFDQDAPDPRTEDDVRSW